MAVRVKGLIAFVLAVVFIFMTLSALFPRTGDRSADITASLNPQTTEAAGEYEEAGRTVTSASGTIHEPSDDTPNAHQIPPERPASPTSEWDIAEPVRQTHLDPTKEFRILVGVMSPFSMSTRRHIMRNAYRQFPKDLPVDVWFIMGDIDPWNPVNAGKVQDTYRLAREWENNTNHDIMGVDCTENMEDGKTYEYLKKVGREFSNRYTHVMKSDDDSFVNLPGNYLFISVRLTLALVQIIREHKDEPHLYWGATYTDGRFPAEMWGSGYLLSMDLVEWIARSEIPINNTIGLEDLQVVEWIVDGGFHDNAINNLTAFAGYPWPELGDKVYKQENEIRPFERWTLVTHPLKENFMWVDTANYYLSLQW